jgi:hypothetical protein
MIDASGLQQVRPVPGYSFVKVTADALVLTGKGVLHTITMGADAAPTAGTLIVYDSITEAGTEIFSHTFTTTPFVPFSVLLDAIVSNGIYAGFTTTADVQVTFTYA